MNNKKAKVAEIDYGFAKVQGLMLPSGEYRIGVSQIAEFLQLDKTIATREVKALLGKDLQFKKVYSELNPKAINTISLEDLNCLVHILAKKGNLKAQELLSEKEGIKITPIIKKSKKKLEKEIQAKLHNKIGGLTEVECLAGRIDLLTSSQIIEIKQINQWKEAIGQVLVYGHYYPSHEKRIHLFGETQESYLNIIKTHCDKLGILLTWEY